MSELLPDYDDVPVDDGFEPDDAEATHDGDVSELLAELER